jgi:ATP-binding cassette subfamily F protein 3
MIQLKNLSLRRGLKELLINASLTLNPGYKTGLVGANGVGKSSLFALLKGELHADGGDADIPKQWVMAHVAQETPALDTAAIDYVLDGDQELRQLEAELAAAEARDDGSAIGHLHGELARIEAYSAPARAAKLLTGLGFAVEAHRNPVKSFSGGWRMRLNLAQALMCRSDLLLLDEPTNHLDLETVLWLEDWLQSYPGTLLIISHDRDFLDSICSHIAEVANQTLTLYTGNYSQFETMRAEKLARQQGEFDKQQRQIAHLESFITRFKAKATKAKQAQSRVKALEKLERIAPAHVASPFDFHFDSPDNLPNPLLRLDKVDIGYGSSTILRGLSLSVEAGSRIGLLGVNGAGKSTLVKLLAATCQLRRAN